ncbi:MAG: Peptidase M23B and LisM domain [candidate division WS6 bacterium GW2011_GWF2_39_15]|uniref:Peptidase M23B and LisM domain n=1 Tax=candidate division WS6 bacterium GW2011_GWF2_39_15 TaxID=1619100 RepID=A0A0G0MSH6_9BACT|nr:MAG: Peptidase M23B and LisM domain [candidate division WS6 bacterium GW2011_GWF2_39_15]
MTIRGRYAPKISGFKYLSSPIKKYDFISEGFIYNAAERSIHGQFFHKGIDYSAPYGTPVYAAAAGYAVASYHRFPVLRSDFTIQILDGKPLGNGLGYFVQIYHPENISGVKGGRITQYGHLSYIINKLDVKLTQVQKINLLDRIKKVNDAKVKNGLSNEKLNRVLDQQEKIMRSYPWVQTYHGYNFSKDLGERESYLYSPTELAFLYEKRSPFVKYVEQGEEIGRVGASALLQGKPSYSEYEIHPSITEPKVVWDEYHLHFEEADRDWNSGRKGLQRDPYNIYKTSKWYLIKENLKSSLFV